MTDMKISAGAVDVMLRTSPLYFDMGPGGTCAHQKERISESFVQALAAALRYYAAHPEELPQEVVDAVLADAPRRQMQSLAKRVLDRQMEMDRILDDQSKRDT